MNDDRIFGYAWEDIQAMQQGTHKPKVVIDDCRDFGCDPIGDGTFRMVPSGRVVTKEMMEEYFGK